MDGLLRDRLTLIAALGTGVVVGFSGIYLYYKLNRNVTRELSHLAGTIADLRKEIELLKSSTGELRSSSSSTTVWKRSVPKKVPVNGEITKQKAAELSAQPSTSSFEDDSEEYFDFTDVDDIENSWTGLKRAEGVEEAVGDQKRPGAEDPWLESIDNKLDEPGSKEDLYHSIKTKKEEYANNANYLWRMAKVTHLCGITAQKNRQLLRKKELAFEAFGYAKDALAADDKNPEVHKWYAITVGSLSEFVGVQQKIQNGYEFKEHVDMAVKLKPADPTLHHMLGRWCFEVATLTWIERKLASTLYSAPPQSTVQEARAHLFAADKLKNNWKENMLFIAKTYICDGNYSPAISWIDRAVAVPCAGEGDEVAHRELVDLMEQYQRYRS